MFTNFKFFTSNGINRKLNFFHLKYSLRNTNSKDNLIILNITIINGKCHR